MRLALLTRPRIALATALALLGLGAWLSASAERPVRAAAPPRIDFPTHPRPAEWQRIAERQTLPEPTAPPDAGPDEPAPPRDPFLRALPIDPGDHFVVLEANALRHSRLGELFVQCVLAEEPGAFEEFARETGVDPLKDVDRVGFAGDAIVVSGFFDRVRWDVFERGARGRPERYGDAGRIWTVEGSAHAIGAWGDQLLVTGPVADVRRAIDQVEGRAEAARQDLSDDMAYGELYGVVPGEAARRLLPAGEEALAARLAAAAQRIELHVDAMEDVAGVLRVASDAGREAEDLAKALGAALSVARVKAAATGDEKLSALLEHAEVVPGDAGFRVQLALPADLLQEFFGDCGRARQPGGR